MKRVFALMVTGIFFLFIGKRSFCQNSTVNFKTTIIEPYPLKITTNKTINLIFSYAIKSVDRGSADVLAQKAKGVENILLVKAGRQNFSETNLSVITADGKLYSFLLDYINNPTAINISFENDTLNTNVPSSFKPLYNEASMRMDAERVIKQKKSIHGIRDYRYEVRFSLNGIYIKNDVIFFMVQVANNSNINYDVDMLRFFIKDATKAKRTATQEIEVQPIYVLGDTSTIKGDTKNTIVFALPKFTIPDRKYLSIQLMEKNGGRNLQLSVRNRTIIKASKL
ncbi:MAG: conjugative transposon protein TraN [Segetibacter sp.]|nr:conjugative transposon protein TraN [Segetibacter sp.]